MIKVRLTQGIFRAVDGQVHREGAVLQVSSATLANLADRLEVVTEDVQENGANLPAKEARDKIRAGEYSLDILKEWAQVDQRPTIQDAIKVALRKAEVK